MNFLKKRLRPLLQKIGMYGFFYRLFFLIVAQKRFWCNVHDRVFHKTATIVLYHRIANLTSDPTLLAIPPERFSSHLALYKKFYEIVDLGELVYRIKDNRLTGKELAITFDDGYADNLYNALPVLESFQSPATVFVATSQLGEEAHHPWDMKYSPNDRAHFMSEKELEVLSSHPLITIGAHTHSHLRLSDLTATEQTEEMMTNKRKLEGVLNQKVLFLAYPFGGNWDINEASLYAANNSGFIAAFTNTQRFAHNSVDSNDVPFAISRFNIRNYSNIVLGAKLFNFKIIWQELKEKIVKYLSSK